MSTSNGPEWTGTLATAVNFQTVIGAVAATVASAVYQKYPNTDDLLEYCRQELEEVRARLNEIPQERREQIQAVVERGGCKSFQELEETLLGSVPSTDVYVHIFEVFHMSRFSDDRYELRERSINTPSWQRRLPATGLRYDIVTLRDSIRNLLKDTCVRDSIGFQSIQVFTY